MSLVGKQSRLLFQTFDHKLLALHTENPTLTNAALAKKLGCGYDEIVRSLRRSGIVRKTGRPKRKLGEHLRAGGVLVNLSQAPEVR